MRTVNSNQLFTVKAVRKFCEAEIKGDKHLFDAQRRSSKKAGKDLRMRYATAGTVLRTKSFHHLITDEVGLLKFKEIPDDKSFYGEHNFLSSKKGLFSAFDLPS